MSTGLHRDPTPALQPEIAEILDHCRGGFAGDVTGHHVTGRFAGRTGAETQVRYRRIGLKMLENLLGQLGWADGA